MRENVERDSYRSLKETDPSYIKDYENYEQTCAQNGSFFEDFFRYKSYLLQQDLSKNQMKEREIFYFITFLQAVDNLGD